MRLARPQQFLKNGFIFLPLFFGHKLEDPVALKQTFFAFIAFCFFAGAVYAINDLADSQEDRAHPVKKFRPVANGEISPVQAVLFAFFLATLGSLFSFAALGTSFILVVAAYLVINLAYSFALKHVAVLDVVIIGFGFVLRVEAGGISAGVQVSHWLVIMAFLLALFLALAKRRDDLLQAAGGKPTRRSIDGYSLEFVSLSIAVMASVVVVSYIMYTLAPDVIALHGTDKLYLTAFWVIAGIVRYMRVTFVEEDSGSPTRVLIQDHFLQVVILGWILSLFALLYPHY